MLKFLKVLKIIVGIPFFALCALLVALGGFVLHLFFRKRSNPQKEHAREELKERKEQYKKTSKVVVIDDIAQHLEASFKWEDATAISVLGQKEVQKKKALAKRRKRKKLAKKSRQQNRK
jgi:transposase